jgi:MATE family multidrug resistance protein
MSTPTVRAEVRSLARLAVPLAIANAGQAAMGLVDTAVCGRAGPAVLAGAGLGNALSFSAAIFGMGLMMGLDPLIAQAFGAGDDRRARHFLWQGSWLALGAGVLIAVPMAFVPLAFEPLGIDAEVAREASRFVWVRLPSLPLVLLFCAVRSYLQARGLTRAVVVATILANVANLGGDLLFVFGGGGLPAWTGPLRALPALGAAGSALSTSVVTGLQALLLALAVRAVPTSGGAAGLRRPVRAELAHAARVGLPVALHMGAEVGIFALVGFLAARLGRVPLAAHQVAIALSAMTFTFAVGIGAAGSVRVGWAVGARDREGARRAGLTSFGAGACVMSVGALAFFAFPAALARVMTDDAAVVQTAAPLLIVAAFFQIADGIQAVGAGVLRGAGDTRFTFVANMVGHWLVGFPIAVALGVVGPLGVTGLWWGLCAGLCAVGASLFARFLRLSAREIAPIVSTGEAARSA